LNQREVGGVAVDEEPGETLVVEPPVVAGRLGSPEDVVEPATVDVVDAGAVVATVVEDRATVVLVGAGRRGAVVMVGAGIYGTSTWRDGLGRIVALSTANATNATTRPRVDRRTRRWKGRWMWWVFQNFGISVLNGPAASR